MLPFCIVSFDLSAIDIDACGGPFGVDTPIMNVKIYDSPGGIFNFYFPGTLLDEDTLIGIEPGYTVYTFNWSHSLVSMDIDGATDGNITVVFDLWRSGYAAIDNLLIISSITGINEVASHPEIMLCPNPAHDRVELRGLNNWCNVVITDLCGRVLKKAEVMNERVIDVSDMVAGNYLVTVYGREMITSQKLVVM